MILPHAALVIALVLAAATALSERPVVRMTLRSRHAAPMAALALTTTPGPRLVVL